MSDLGYAHGRAGHQEEALRVLDELTSAPGGRPVSPYSIAMVHMGLGNEEQALDWLEKGYEERDVGMIWIKAFDIFSDHLGDNPRYIELLEKVGLQE